MLRNLFILFFILLNSYTVYSQICTLDSITYTHVNCYGENTGSINVTLLQSDNIYQKSYWWKGPNGFTANQTLTLSNLAAGDYVLTIMSNIVEGDTSSNIWFSNLVNDDRQGAPMDTIIIRQTIPITADFTLTNMCNLNDSVDVSTQIWGGTPPYSTLWSRGDTSRDITDLIPGTFPDTLKITDKNNCVSDQLLIVEPVLEMNSLMFSNGVKCKDDNSGSASVVVVDGTGTPPFEFNWITINGGVFNDISTSSIEGLYPGIYPVVITDEMGCITKDSITVSSDPSTCLTIYRVFSPNDDAVHEFWEIENINLYPEALVLVYDRNGRQVYRRRNYQNVEGEAFGGKDQEERTLPSGNYYYIIDLENGDKVFKGTLTIVR
jgi:gliding motility-associated-like protein